jgi:hypothetical protein
MRQASNQEFRRLLLRVHDLLADVPIHDLWAVDLPSRRSGITLDEYLRTANWRPCKLSAPARALLSFRLLVGRLLGWDREPAANQCETLANNRRSLEVPCAGGHAGRTFGPRVPLRKRTTARVDQPDGTRCSTERPGRNFEWVPVLFAVYVRSVSRFTPYWH